MNNPFLFLVNAWLRRYWAPPTNREPQSDVLRPAIIITGASEGIGLEIARRYGRDARNTIILIARDEQRLSTAIESLQQSSAAKLLALPLDITDSDCAKRIDAVLSAHQLYPDILVNNAGKGLAGEFLMQPANDLEALIDLNIRAATALMRHYLPGMCRRGRGGVLNVSSLGGAMPGPYQAAYYASKGYLIALTRAVRYETRGQGVRVAVLLPGPVNTRFHRKMRADLALYRRIVPAASPAWIARCAAFGFRWGLGVIYPGPATALTVLVTRILPGIILLPIVGLLLRLPQRTKGRD